MENTTTILRIAKKEDANAIHHILQEVYCALENKDLFVCDDLTFIQNHIEKNGFTVVACQTNGQIAGCLIVRFPFQEEDNLARDVGLAPCVYNNVAHMESAAVLPQYRGQHLELQMLNYAEKYLNPKQFHYLFATVSPDNPASYKTLENAGYCLQITKKKYNGKLRRIYLKKKK